MSTSKNNKRYTEKLLKESWVQYLPFGTRLHDLEHVYIFTSLARLGWNRTRTSNMLGINLRTIRNRIKLLKDLGYPVKDNPDKIPKRKDETNVTKRIVKRKN